MLNLLTMKLHLRMGTSVMSKYISESEIENIIDIVDTRKYDEQEVIHGNLISPASDAVLFAVKALEGQSNLNGLSNGLTGLTLDCLDDVIAYETEIGDSVEVLGLEIIRDTLSEVRGE
jgi:hypothetical protein